MKNYHIVVVIMLLGYILSASAKDNVDGIDSLDTIQAVQTIEVIKAAKDIHPARAELGKKLFFDPRLSRSGMISCNSCHNLSTGGTIPLKTFVGPQWAKGSLNVPTVFNVSLSLVQHWDGEIESLEKQAAHSLQAPEKMGSSHEQVIKTLSSIPDYVQAFKAAFDNDQLTINQVTQAIAEFERTLVTPNSRFDQWLMGKKDVLTATELAGYELFQKNDCITCHNGVAIGGNLYEEMGLFNKQDGAKEEVEFQTYKVPTLRNIALTAPYFHDGEVKTLAKAVRMMGDLQLGENFTAEEVEQLVAFLNTLTGEQPTFALPMLPPSTAATPLPKPFN